MSVIKQAVILAGGKGTRLAPFTDTAAKPMYPIHGKPFLAYLLEQVKGFGIERVLILLGYMAESVSSRFGGGRDLGLDISYSVSDTECETQRRLYNARSLIDGDFLMMYCDNYCPLDFGKMEAQFGSSGVSIQLAAYSNKDGYTKSNILYDDKDFRILKYDKKRLSEGLNAVDIGYALVRRDVLDTLGGENVNFEGNIYPRLTERRALAAYVTDHRYYSIGSWERIGLTETFFSGQRAVFLDRDGTLNVRPPRAAYVEKPEDFVWLPGAREAVKLLNGSGCKVYIVTNQPGIARGNMSLSDLERVHGKMLGDLEEAGARADKIYFCPHGWDDGCDCRKPAPGMLFTAQREHNFDMSRAVFFGDDERDMEAARAAGCRGVLVTEEKGLLECVRDFLASLANR